MKVLPILAEVIADIVCLAGVTFVWVYMLYSRVPVVIRGFYCNDDSIRYPQRPDTIPEYTLYLIVAGVALLVIIYEMVRHCGGCCGRRSKFSSVCGQCVWACYKHTYALAFGACLAQMFVQTAKVFTGRLRPYFLSACRPDYASFDCKDQFGEYRYIEEDVCLERNASLLDEARKSFPSGHTASTTFAMVYFIMYAEARVTNGIGCSIKITLQSAALLFSIYVGVTRVFDHSHHATDVIASNIIGLILGVFIAYSVTGLLHEIVYLRLPGPAGYNDTTDGGISGWRKPNVSSSRGGQYEYIEDNAGFSDPQSVSERAPLISGQNRPVATAPQRVELEL